MRKEQARSCCGCQVQGLGGAAVGAGPSARRCWTGAQRGRAAASPGICVCEEAFVLSVCFFIQMHLGRLFTVKLLTVPCSDLSQPAVALNVFRDVLGWLIRSGYCSLREPSGSEDPWKRGVSARRDFILPQLYIAVMGSQGGRAGVKILAAGFLGNSLTYTRRDTVTHLAPEGSRSHSLGSWAVRLGRSVPS